MKAARHIGLESPSDANDILFEARAICDFMNAELVVEPLSVEQVLGIIRRRETPTGRIARKLVGSKTAIRAAFIAIANRTATPAVLDPELSRPKPRGPVPRTTRRRHQGRKP
jgi:hypothetical protein